MKKPLILSWGAINFLVTYHHVTLFQEGSEKTIRAILKAIDEFPSSRVLFTMPNSDKDNKIIGKMIDGYINRDSGRAKSFISLGQLRYLSVIKNVDIVLGNSSSGLTEVPVFNKPTVNIGDRQKGRLRASSIIDCEENVKSISLAIDKALSEDFQKSLGDIYHPYKSGNASKAISKTLKNFNLDGVLTKEFYNLKP